jgi:D-lactate dehydrogenase (cytochrome)
MGKVNADELISLLSGDQVSVNQTIREQHSVDESYHRGPLPDAVVFPESVEDVVSIVQYASSRGIPLIPFGAGSSLEGHVIAVRGGISVDLSRMNRILEVRPQDFLVRVQPGVRRTQLNEYLKPYGLFFPVDPGADATLGGMAATNASGTTTVRYGAMRDNVRSLQVVLPDGRIIRTASLAAKSSSGYNLTSLFVGSEGTLGIITELWLKVYGIPEQTIAARAQFPDIASCVRTATAIIGCGIPVNRMEYVSPELVDKFNLYKQLNLPVKPTLLLEFCGSGASVRNDVDLAMEIAKDEGCTQFEFVASEAERLEMWRVRHHALYAFMHQFPGHGHMSTDVCVPISKLPDAVTFAQDLLKETGIPGGIIGHVGDGNFHVMIPVKYEDEAYLATVYDYNERLVKFAISLGGTCTGEHGVGLGKRKYQELEHGAALEVMRTLKKTLDPLHIMNPGKLVDPD